MTVEIGVVSPYLTEMTVEIGVVSPYLRYAADRNVCPTITGVEASPYVGDCPRHGEFSTRRAGTNVCPAITGEEGRPTRQQSPAGTALSRRSSGRIAGLGMSERRNGLPNEAA